MKRVIDKERDYLGARKVVYSHANFEQLLAKLHPSLFVELMMVWLAERF